MEWEQLPKHIFILSAAGKPIFTRHGDEQDLVTVFGLLQAVYSIAQDMGDKIRCIMAGKRRILYFVRGSLYFVCISSTGEPEIVLQRQLEFMYSQILLVLTGKVQDVLRNNFSKDLRDLLGSETSRLLSASCANDITSPTIAFSTTQSLVMDRALRKEMLIYLRQSVQASSAAVGLLMVDQSVICYCINNGSTADSASQSLNSFNELGVMGDYASSLILDISDVLLLTHFVGNSSSLRSHEHSWVPLCLPTFNSAAYLQALVATIKLPPVQNSSNNSLVLSLVLIATSAAPEVFKDLLVNGNERFAKYVNQPEVGLKLSFSIENKFKFFGKILYATSGVHFLFKFRPSATSDTVPAGAPALLPSQGVWSPFANSIASLSSKETQNKIWTVYQRLACYLRCGSSLPEVTLINTTAGSSNGNSTSCEDDVNILSTNPSPDHSLAYVVLEEGLVIVGLASLDAELFVTFPSSIGTLESCNQACVLLKNLKSDYLLDMFQVEI